VSVRRSLLIVLVAVLGLLAGCASFPDAGPRDWQNKIEGQGELGGPPAVAQPDAPTDDGGQAPPPGSASRQTPEGCVDPDPRVVATCLDPVGAVAPLPGTDAALVAERNTGRVLRVQRDSDPQLVTTLGVDASAGGVLGLVLSPAYAEDRLLYALIGTPTGSEVVRIPPGEPAKPVLTGLPRSSPGVGGLAVGQHNTLLVATAADGTAADPHSLAGKILQIDTLGRPAPSNPDPTSPVLATGLRRPGGICAETDSGTIWATDRDGSRDLLYRVTAGPLRSPAWTWPDRPGVAGCAAQPDAVGVALSGAGAMAILKPGADGRFADPPQLTLANTFGRLSATAVGADGLVWLGTVNKSGGKPVPSDDRAIRLPLLPSGGADRA
jgi:glucose/arabinose dehydrogenase